MRTDKECLLVALNAKDETLWRYNADRVCRWMAEHRRNMQRWADDSRFEHRAVPSLPAAANPPPTSVTGLAKQLTPTFRRAVNLVETNFHHVFDVPPVGAHGGALRGPLGPRPNRIRPPRATPPSASLRVMQGIAGLSPTIGW